MSKNIPGQGAVSLLAAIAASFFLAPVGARADSGQVRQLCLTGRDV